MALLRCGILMVASIFSSAGEGAEANYVGGTVGGLRPGSDGRALLTDPEAFVFTARGVTVKVPYGRINLIEYGQKVDRRLMEAILISPLLILSKKRQHFLTVGFEADDGSQEAMLFKVDKRHIRAMLVSLEARTGRKVSYQDEEARKAGKG